MSNHTSSTDGWRPATVRQTADSCTPFPSTLSCTLAALADGFRTVLFRAPLLALPVLLTTGLLLGPRVVADDGVVPDSPNYSDGASSSVQSGTGSGARIYRIQFRGGEGIANRESFVSLEMLSPIWLERSSDGDEQLGFFDGRLGILDSHASVNLGLGYRRYVASQNRVWGVNSWFDVDDTKTHTFTQAGVGFETYGEGVEFLANGYIPVGERTRTYGYTPLLNEPFFYNHSIMLPRYRLEEQAMTGFDVQVGHRIPGSFARRHDTRGYLGYYRFDADDVEAANGFAARLEGQVATSVLLQLLLTHDDVFDTNFMVGLIWDLTKGFHRAEPDRGYVRNRIKRRLQRNQFVVTTTRRFDEAVAAIDPGTGEPYVVRHFNSAAAAGGNGTHARPFNDLSAAADTARSDTGNLLVLHADSVFVGQTLQLQDSQRALGELGTYVFDTEQIGPITLPRATTGTATPIIRNAPAAGVILANSSQAHGLRIENSASAGILADGVSGALELSNISVDGSQRGLEIRNSPGSFNVDSLTVTNVASDGFLLAENSGTLQFTGSQSITNPSGVGVNIQGGSATISFEGLQVNDYQNSAIAITNSAGAVTFQQSLSLVNSAGSSSPTIGISSSGGNITFNGVTIDDTHRAGPGLPAVDLVNLSNQVDFGDLSITTNNGGGIRATNVATVNTTGGVINSTGGPALDFNGISGGSLVFDALHAAGAANGVLFRTTGNSFDGSLTVRGDGQNAGSGGTITTSNVGVVVENVENISLNFLEITSGGTGIWSINSDNVLVSRTSLASPVSAGWIGIRVDNTIAGKTGTPIILSQNTITGGASNQTGIFLHNNQSPLGSASIGGHTITLTGINAVGINLLATGTSPDPGPGDMTLFSSSDNIVTTPLGSTFDDTETNASFFGNILVNGVPLP